MGGSSDLFRTGKRHSRKANISHHVEQQTQQNKQKYNYQVYSMGSDCYANGKTRQRLTNVYYYCNGNKEGEIIDVREPETCIYNVLVYSAFACSELLEKQSLHYLDYLGVFGFSKG